MNISHGFAKVYEEILALQDEDEELLALQDEEVLGLQDEEVVGLQCEESIASLKDEEMI